MHGLRPSVLLRRSERLLTLALLCAGQALFLWMFLAADAIEQRAPTDVVRRFASDWRHGMAANSWLYMPGFFATAAAVWLLSLRVERGRAIARDLGACAAAAGIVAALASAPGSRLAAHDLFSSTGIALSGALPAPSARGALQGLYTLLTWTAFVMACRVALARRRWQPFLAPAILAIGLALIRPWTVDDFTALWAARAGRGDAVASLSLAAAIAMGALLAVAAQRSQRRSRPPYATGMRRADTTISR